ncbi:amidohydrolase family protein [Solwaraspora sp. WMMD1047]|jgi:predicted TIM-barrel fold metal-dependent hydrolase|uniref:amidohydrolase family protein n=1 Tax=Solwaraspora sp. WMMD1047 TaxID=3016102 RepID=UPI0024179234|nr:amidohydrolase family protein [Solwaraspora sp. WMMD1047]MDG4830035.1 amidohydrolase family protein [Solwaraspora sp. WMMD1047]
MRSSLNDAHRHLGVLPAYPFYGGPPVSPATTARATIDELIADLDAEGTARALVLPNYGVPDPDVAFGFNELVVEAAQRDDRIRCGLWVSAQDRDRERTAAALRLAGEDGVRALKVSFLLGGTVDDPGLEPIFAAARAHDLVVHVHTSPGAASDIDRVGQLVDRYADDVRVHLVHFGGGMSGHIKLIGTRFFDWVAAGKQVYTDLSWAIGFAPRWLVSEIDRRGLGHDRVLFASDEPWGDHAGELARLSTAVGGAELSEAVFQTTFDKLYA